MAVLQGAVNCDVLTGCRSRAARHSSGRVAAPNDHFAVREVIIRRDLEPQMDVRSKSEAMMANVLQM